MKAVQRIVKELREECSGKDPREALATIALEVGSLPQVRRLVAEFADTKKYPERPSLLLCKVPTIYLLGWREGDGTGVHDHGLSQVGIQVVQGCIVEDLYVTDDSFSGASRKVLLSFSRNLRQGDLITCPANYIHRFTNIFPEVAATLHVYGPKLSKMSSWEDKVGYLEFKEFWQSTTDKEKVL